MPSVVSGSSSSNNSSGSRALFPSIMLTTSQIRLPCLCPVLGLWNLYPLLLAQSQSLLVSLVLFPLLSTQYLSHFLSFFNFWVPLSTSLFLRSLHWKTRPSEQQVTHSRWDFPPCIIPLLGEPRYAGSVPGEMSVWWLWPEA